MSKLAKIQEDGRDRDLCDRWNAEDEEARRAKARFRYHSLIKTDPQKIARMKLLRDNPQHKAYQQAYQAIHRKKPEVFAQNDAKRKAKRRDPGHRARMQAYDRKRTAEKLRATPPWANQQYMEDMYLIAQLVTEATGIRYEVDHIIPLQGKKVRGLHVEDNLQVITREANVRKNNRFQID